MPFCCGAVTLPAPSPTPTARPSRISRLRFIRDDSGWWQHIRSANTNAAGYYDIDGLATGTYRLGFQDGGWPDTYTTEYYDDAPDVDSATDVSVIAEITTPGIDAALSGGGNIAGMVSDSGGLPLANIYVEAFQYEYSGYGLYVWRLKQWSITDSGGNYNMAGLPDGAYRVGFFDRPALTPTPITTTPMALKAPMISPY